MTAHLIIRAEVPDENDREAFDRWYDQEHLPQAVAAFRAVKAWRGWSETDPAVHYAFYEFRELSALQRVLEPDVMGPLKAEFDRCWGARVPRSREVVVSRQTLAW